MSRLDEIKARADAATPGPWSAADERELWREDDPSIEPSWCVSQMRPGFEAMSPTEGYVGDVFTTAGFYDSTRPDAEFIAAAREDVPWLLAVVESGQRMIEALTDELMIKAAKAERLTAARDAQTKRAERLERWYADALTMLDKSRRWKSVASLTAGRDSLAARLALVEALAEAEVARLTAERDALAATHARESEKVWKVEEVMDDIEGSDPTTWERLRDALSGSGADTSDTQTTDQEVSDE